MYWRLGNISDYFLIIGLIMFLTMSIFSTIQCFCRTDIHTIPNSGVPDRL